MDKATIGTGPESMPLWPTSRARRAGIGVGATAFILNASGAIVTTALEAYHFAHMVTLDYVSCAMPLSKETQANLQIAARAHEGIVDQASNASLGFFAMTIGSAALVAASFYRSNKE